VVAVGAVLLRLAALWFLLSQRVVQGLVLGLVRLVSGHCVGGAVELPRVLALLVG